LIDNCISPREKIQRANLPQNAFSSPPRPNGLVSATKSSQGVIEILSAPVVFSQYDAIADDLAESVDKHCVNIRGDGSRTAIASFKQGA